VLLADGSSSLMKEALRLTSGKHFDFADLGEDYRTIAVHRDSNPFTIEVMFLGERTECPGCKEAEFIGNGRKTVPVWDLPRNGPTKLAIRRQSYLCTNPSCSTTVFFAKPTKIDEWHRVTDRLRDYIIDHVIRRFPLEWLSVEIGVSRTTITNIFMESFRKLEKEHITVLGPWVGIDEVRVGENVRCNITDLKKRRVLEILEDDKDKTINKYFESVPFGIRDGVKAIAFDHRESFRGIGAAKLVNSGGVADHYHFAAILEECFTKVLVEEEAKFMMFLPAEYEKQMAGKSFSAGDKGKKEKAKTKKEIKSKVIKDKKRLKKSRRVLLSRYDKLGKGKKASVRRLLKDYPQIKVAYELKERLLKIWNSNISSEDARELYGKWKESIPEELNVFFHDITGLVTSWGEEIFEFYKDRLTNAYTEAMNNQFQKYYSNAASCGFELLRAVFLYQTFFDDNAARRKAALGVAQGDPHQSGGKDDAARMASMLKAQERVRQLHRRRAAAIRARKPGAAEKGGPLLIQ
jgi:transposase